MVRSHMGRGFFSSHSVDNRGPPLVGFGAPAFLSGGTGNGQEGGHHTWLRDWMALDSAAARARLCHMEAGLWEEGCRESFSARDSIMA